MTVAEAEQRLRDAGHRVTLSGDTDTDGAAAFIGVAGRTLQGWIAAGDGPPSLKYGGGTRMFPIAELLAWREGRKDGVAETRAQIRADSRKPRKPAQNVR